LRSAKLIAPRKIEIFEESMPLPLDDEVLVQIKAAGICGTDLHVFQGERADVSFPRVMGHELVGEVISMGRNVKNFSQGDNVTIDPVVSCGKCTSCKRGYDNLCSTVKCIGVQIDGGFCDFIAVPASKVYRIPAGIPFEIAPLIEPFSIAAEVLSRSEVKEGEKVLVIGSGTIGLCILQAMKLAGAEVFITDFVESRLDIAEKCGADKVMNIKKGDLGKSLLEFSGDFGVDVIIEAVGISKLLEESFCYAAPGGRVVVLGFDDKPARISEASLVRKELKIAGSRMNCHRFPQVIEWFDKHLVDPIPLVSARYQFEQIQDASMKF